MKLLYFFIANLLCFSAFAADQHWTPYPPNGTLYSVLKDCPGKCYPLKQPDGSIALPDVFSLKKKNLLGGHESLASCQAVLAEKLQPWDRAQCQKVVDQGSDDLGNTVCAQNTQSDYCWHYGGDAICRDVGGGVFESYCAVFEEDAAKVAAKAAALAAQAQEKSQRASKMSQVKTNLMDCHSTLKGSPTAGEMAACMRAIVKQLVSDQLDVGEL